MPRTRHITTIEQTSIGANGFRLQYIYEKKLYEVCHSHHNGRSDVIDRTLFVNEKDARKYLETLMTETQERINEFKVNESFPLITKII
jgi:hypothetical protein